MVWWGGGGGGREIDVTLWANLRTLNRNSIGIVPTGSVTCVGGITIRVILQLLYNNSIRISNTVGGRCVNPLGKHKNTL